MKIKKIVAAPRLVFEDNHLLIVDKPASMAVVPDASGDFSLLDWGKRYLKRTRNKPGNVFLAVVHRIDRPVSGLVCFAITSKAASRLSKQLREHRMSKEYLAISANRPDKHSGIIESYLLKDRRKNLVSVVPPGRPRAKRALTRWELISCRKGLCLFLLEPVTGRSHQLRVHMTSLGCPIFGDKKYGSRRRFLNGRGIALHSYRLVLFHPTRGEAMEFRSPLPQYFPYPLFEQEKY